MATNTSFLAWKIPWRKEPGWLNSMGFERVGHCWAHKHIHLTKLGYKSALFFLIGLVVHTEGLWIFQNYLRGFTKDYQLFLFLHKKQTNKQQQQQQKHSFIWGECSSLLYLSFGTSFLSFEVKTSILCSFGMSFFFFSVGIISDQYQSGSILKSDWLYYFQPQMERLYRGSKNKTVKLLWLKIWVPSGKIQI